MSNVTLSELIKKERREGKKNKTKQERRRKKPKTYVVQSK